MRVAVICAIFLAITVTVIEAESGRRRKMVRGDRGELRSRERKAPRRRIGAEKTSQGETGRKGKQMRRGRKLEGRASIVVKGNDCEFIYLADITSNSGCSNGQKFVLKGANNTRKQFLIVNDKAIIAFITKRKKFTACESFTDITTSVSCKSVSGLDNITLPSSSSNSSSNSTSTATTASGGAANTTAAASNATTTAAPASNTTAAPAASNTTAAASNTTSASNSSGAPTCSGDACTTILNRRSLAEYNNAICNDGSTAVYYVDEEAHKDGQSVMVYLEGGGACFTDQTCSDRCEGAEAEYLCQAQTDPVKDFSDNVWSKDATTNPGLYDSFKVYVPYCTSDAYSGRKGASSGTGGYAFYGKAVVEGLVEDLLTKVIGTNSMRQFTLMGVSAGAFGVAFNCDAVAAAVKAKDPNADVRCIMDSNDFIPTNVDGEICNPLEANSVGKAYWQAEFDQSCEQANGADSTVCNVFTTYYQEISTPFMLIIPLEEVDPGVHPCAPEWPENPSFWSRWREALHTLAQQLAQDVPNAGMFMSNCAHHVSLANPTTWAEMPVPALDPTNTATDITLNKALSNWLKDARPFQALDEPTSRNPACPFDD